MVTFLIQALLPVYICVSFFLYAYKFWSEYKETRNNIAKFLAYSFWVASLSFLVVAFAIIIFSSNMRYLSIATNIFWVLDFIAVAFVWWAAQYVFVRLPMRLLLGLLLLGEVFLIVNNTVSFIPTVVGKDGLIVLPAHPLTYHLGNIITIVTFASVGVVFILKTMRKKMVLKGTVLGVGLIMTVLFLSAAYTLENLTGYLAFGFLGAVGLLLFTIGLYFFPEAGKDKIS